MTDDDFKLNKKQFKELNKGFLYKHLRKSGYKINTYLILAGFIFPICLLLYNGYVGGWVEKYTVRCPADSMTDCKNPFYSCDPITSGWCPSAKMKALVCGQNPGFCLMPLLRRGDEYGDKKTFIEKNFTWIILISLAVVYALNHYLYNSKELRNQRKKEWNKK